MEFNKMIKLERTFYPVGQGAFYRETFIYDDNQRFNIVYDCGTLSSIKSSEKNQKTKNKIDDVILNSFQQNEEIDILFISHFDEDHVNKIALLAQEFHIKKVVMPLVEQTHKEFLLRIYQELEQTICFNILNNPQNFFGENTQIILVEPAIDNNDDDINEIHIDAIQNNTIKSATSLYKTFPTFKWHYITYNYQFNKRSKEFQQLLQQQNIDLDNLNLAKSNERKIIKQIYQQVEGNINDNSMLVFSTIIDDSFTLDQRFLMGNQNPYFGCLYCGDVTLNNLNTEPNFWRIAKLFQFIGTIQVAHHGSKNSFHIDFFKKIINKHYKQNFLPMICPISYGTNNGYGHPAINVIQSLNNVNCIPIFVTEIISSIYIQNFYFHKKNTIGYISYKGLIAIHNKHPTWRVLDSQQNNFHTYDIIQD